MNKKLFRMALCATILLAGTARADVIGMRTRKAAPEQLTLALNAGVTAQLAWSGGGTQTKRAGAHPCGPTLSIKLIGKRKL